MHKCSYPVKLKIFTSSIFYAHLCRKADKWPTKAFLQAAATVAMHCQPERWSGSFSNTVQKQTRSCCHSGQFIFAILITKFLDTRLMFAYHVLELTKFPWDTLREWELGPHEWLTTQILSAKNVFPSNGSFALSKFQFVTPRVVAHLVLELNTWHSLVRCEICLLCFCSM